MNLNTIHCYFPRLSLPVMRIMPVCDSVILNDFVDTRAKVPCLAKYEFRACSNRYGTSLVDGNYLMKSTYDPWTCQGYITRCEVRPFACCVSVHRHGLCSESAEWLRLWHDGMSRVMSRQTIISYTAPFHGLPSEGTRVSRHAFTGTDED